MQLKQNKHKFTSISMPVLVHIAWRNLVTRRLRTMLTVIGVVIGIGAISFLLFLGLGLQHLVTEQIMGNASVKSIEVRSSNSRILKLDEQTADKISGLAHVAKLGRSYSSGGSLVFNNSEVDSIVYGIDDKYQDLSKISLIKGRLLKETDNSAIIVNKATLQSLNIKEAGDALGKKIDVLIPKGIDDNLNQQDLTESFTIVGVIDSVAGSEVFVPSHIFSQVNAEQYSHVKLIVDEVDNVADLRKKIESMGFETSSPVDTIDQIDQIFKYFNIILVGFGGIGMIIAVLGMFNTLTISLLERTREIGLMLAIGTRPRDMKLLFIIEAMLLSISGAILGIFGAIVLGSMVNLGMNRLAHGRGVVENFDLFATPIWLVALLILFMVIVGLGVVFIPARRAERISPIDVLRRE